MNIEEKEPPDDENGVKHGVLSGTHGTVLANNLKVDSACEVEKQGDDNASAGLVETKQVRHQQHTTNGNVVFWERFLNVRTIRVLLVENDDSTRHVVTALLRNCNYEVLNAANGMQAWKILEDLSNHVDIILTEVVMPALSGIGLLHKIMSHKTRKNIPVIMTSSHDSMGLVFKCLSKGAVDFLVKPIRKNELKILWQHVWRRYHSSSGSGSESVTQAQKSLKSNTSERSGDNAEHDGSNGRNTGDGSDDGSSAQSSWTRHGAEVDSSRALSPTDQTEESPDSTCAQVIPSSAEKSDNNKEQVSLGGGGLQQKQPDNVENNDDNLEMVAPVPEPINSSARESDSATEPANRININHSANDDSKELSLEISLKRLRGIQDPERYVQEDRCVLRRSEQSAFSRYNTSSANAFKAPNEITGSSTIIDNSMEATKMEAVGRTQLHSSEHTLHQFSNGVSSTVDMGSTTAKLSAFKPVENNELRCSKQQASHPDVRQPTDISASSGSKHDFQIRYTNCHHESSSVKFAVDASHCGSTNAPSGPMDVENRLFSLNKSNSGSNHASSGPSGSNRATNTAGNNAESCVDQTGKSRIGDASGSLSGNRDDERQLKRAAAVIKFRQKRKERCFKKKVRYQTRKKLAEQRPRVRGQFVKQTEPDSSYRNGDEEL